MAKPIQYCKVKKKKAETLLCQQQKYIYIQYYIQNR